MGEAIIGPLLNKLQEVVEEEVKLQAGLRNDIGKLSTKLEDLQGKIYDTDVRSLHYSSEQARLRAQRSRKLAFAAEDAIDQFLLQVALYRSQQAHDWVHAVIAFFANCTLHFCVRRSLALKVADLNRQLDEINGADNEKERPVLPRWRSRWRAVDTIPAAHDGSWDDSKRYKLIGHEHERSILVARLYSPTGDVICITGERGIGKTAIVRDVYENKEFRVEENGAHKMKLDIRVWARFPPDASVSVMVQLIYEKLAFECLSNSLIEDVEPYKPYTEYKEIVDNAIGDDKLLLVVDCPIDSTKWNKVRPKLPKGGRILVIVEEVWPGKQNVIRLKRLDDEETKELFCSSLGSTMDTSQNKDYGNVQGVTRGHPLFVVLLAKLLRTKEQDEWDRVFTYIKKSNEEVDRFTTIWSLSFDDLSDELKSCLLYFAGFPENTVIHANRIVHLWIAEGFLSTTKGKTEMEQLGQDYLKELISRGHVQLIKKDVHGNVELVAINLKIHSFLLSEAQRTCFMDIHYDGDVKEEHRRLSLHRLSFHRFAALIDCVPTLRSMLCYFKEDCKDVEEQACSQVTSAPGQEGESSTNFSMADKPRKLSLLCGIDLECLRKEFPLLCVIDLEGLDVGDRLPEEIGNMVNLKYLGIRGCRSLKEVPASTGRLTNLQTLDVRGTSIRELPESFWKIEELRHVLGDDLLFPMSAGDLKFLQTLGTISVQHVDGSTLAVVLEKMTGLRSLHLVRLSESHKQALQDALGKRSSLVRLTLSGEVIPVIFARNPLTGLKYMKLDGKLDLPTQESYPSDILCNLTHLVLKSTNVDKVFISMLASLPFLASLMLLLESYDGEELAFNSDGFKRLTYLSVSDKRLKKIVVQDKALRHLVTLEFIGISKTDLEIVPDSPRIKRKLKFPESKKKSWTVEHMQFINSRLQSP